MTQDIKVVALELANSLENVFFFPGGSDPIRAVVARVEELEAQLSSVGAGGVEPLRKCLHQIAEPVAAAPQAVQPIKANCYSDNDGDSWRDCPDDCDFVDGLELGDTFELQASVRAWSETFRVTKAPDDTSDDYEVELVSTNAPIAATHPTKQGLADDAIERAAKTMSELFDYPWDFMLEQGKAEMREHVKAVLLAAHAKQG